MSSALRRSGPLTILDRAIRIARGRFTEVCLPAWAGGALAVGALIGIYFLERVEGITTLRLPLAALLVLAWWGRALLLGRAAHRVVRSVWEDFTSAPNPPIDVLRTSMVAGFGLWIWSWLIVLGSLAGPVGVILVAPLLALRGAMAPSWIARASAEPEAGFRAFARSFGDSHGRRFDGVLVEGMLLAATFGLAVNLYALAAVGLLLGRSFLGLELASIETFLSPSNTFVLLAIVGLALVLLEPVRASVSALRYVDARVRAEALDLRAAIDESIAHASRRPASGAQRAALLLLFVAFAPSPAFAEPPIDSVAGPLFPGDPGPLPEVALTPEDHDVQREVEAILERPEFREFEDRRGEGLARLFERLFEWLLRPREQAPSFESARLPKVPLPGPWFFIVSAAVLLTGVALYLAFNRGRRESASLRAEEIVSDDPRDRAPESFLDEAAALADEGDRRAALRALYLATLVALDRRRLIAFDPHRTNWQYLRKMPRGEIRDAFAQFTRFFDHKWYGREPTTQPEYERCRALARIIVGEEAS